VKQNEGRKGPGQETNGFERGEHQQQGGLTEWRGGRGRGASSRCQQGKRGVALLNRKKNPGKTSKTLHWGGVSGVDEKKESCWGANGASGEGQGTTTNTFYPTRTRLQLKINQQQGKTGKGEEKRQKTKCFQATMGGAGKRDETTTKKHKKSGRKEPNAGKNQNTPVRVKQRIDRRARRGGY